MIVLLTMAWSQDHAFPTSADDRQHYYPTAYKDHAGVDWNCGTITYGGHQGSDFGAGSFAGMDAGRDVTASSPGTVVTAHDGEFDRCTSGACAGGYGFGNYVKIEHPNGQRTIYGHLKQWSVQVGVGDSVSCGQKLGEMGSSGYSTGPHLHFEVRNASEVAEDPFDGPCSAPPTYWTDQGAYGDIPGGACAVTEPCSPESTLRCGDVITSRNDGVGSVQSTWEYGCSEFVYSGPERAYELIVGTSQDVTLRLAGLSADLDLMALTDAACDGSGCVASSSNPNGSDEEVIVAATAGVPLVVVVDGWEGAVSDYTLTVECSVGPVDTGLEPIPTADTAAAAGDDDDDPGTAGDDDDDPSTGGDDDVGDDDEGGADDLDTIGGPGLPPAPEAGCGCSQGASRAGLGWLAFWAMGWARRRR